VFNNIPVKFSLRNTWIVNGHIAIKQTGTPFAIFKKNVVSMQKRILGYLLMVIGLGGMVLAGYLFMTGSGGRGHLIEITGIMIIGAASFFSGINNIYDASKEFTIDNLQITPELEEVSPIQQQWRTIHIAKQPAKKVREHITAKAG
jgi:hypothetical protein